MHTESPINRGINISFFILELEKIKEKLEDIIIELENLKKIINQNELIIKQNKELLKGGNYG